MREDDGVALRFQLAHAFLKFGGVSRGNHENNPRIKVNGIDRFVNAGVGNG
jgi:hypothetical protein